jgi:predicted ester cyclase
MGAKQDRNRATLQKFYDEAIGKGNVDVIDEVMAEDFVHHGDALFPYIGGSAAIKAGVGGVKAAFPDGKTIIEDTVAEGDIVVSRLSWTGTWRGAFMGKEPNGQPMSWKGISTYRFNEEGLIVERWANQDVVPMLIAMGVLPQMGPS